MRVVCAWELGTSLGHLARQAAIARELLRRGHEAVVVVRELGAVRSFFGHVPVAVLQAPLYQKRLRLNRPQVCQAELLQLSGYRAPADLWPLWQAWRHLLQATGAALLIADHAPTALLAAHSLELPALATGNGFLLPEAGKELMDWRPFPARDGLAEQREREVLAVVNAVLPPGKHLQQLSGLYACRRVVINTFPELDPYAAARARVDYCADNPQEFRLPPGFHHESVHRVVAYLHHSYPRLRELCEGLAACAAEVLVICPGADNDLLQGVAGPRLRVARELVDLDAAITASDLFVGHGSLGTLTQCLRRGRPMLLLPMQVEQLHNAMRAQKLGLARVCPEFSAGREYCNAVVAALKDSSAASHARRFASGHAAAATRPFAEAVADAVSAIAAGN